ncbi:MAG: serine/threonine protein phosphatase PrpC, partial [Kiritimatiellia bacterium]
MILPRPYGHCGIIAHQRVSGVRVRVAWGYGSDARVRGDNQDAFGVFELQGMVLGIVCDGVGSHDGGAQASVLAVRALVEALQNPTGDASKDLQEAISSANRTIYEAGRKSHRLMGMGTTVAAVAIQDGIATIAHVGDSRVYLVRDGVARAMTRDHTMVNMFVDNELLSPEDAESHPEAHVLARSLGSERRVEVEVQHGVQLQDGDVLLVCTDGIHGVLTDGELTDADWKRPATAARFLLRAVAAKDGADNATIIGFRCGGRGEPGMTATPLPTIEHGGDTLTPSSHDLVHAASMLSEPLPPALYPVEPEDEPTAHADDHTEELIQHTAARAKQTPGQLPPRVQARARKEKAPKTKTPDRRRIILLVAGLASAICVAVLMFAVAFKNMQNTGAAADTSITTTELGTDVEPPETDSAPIIVEPDTKSEPDVQPEQADPSTDVMTAPPVEGDAKFYSLSWQPLRRDTKTPRYYSNPLPNPKARVEHRAI